MAENTLPKKNTAYTFYVSLVATGSRPDFQAAPTLATGDVKVSTDGAAFGNAATLPVVTPAAGVAVKVDLSAGEMNGDNVTVTFIDAAGAEWDDLMIEIRPATRKAEDLAFPTTSGRSLDVTATGAAGIDWGNVENPTTAVDLSATDIQLCDTVTTNTDVRGTDSAALASVCTEVRLAELAAGNLPTDVAAIKTETALIVADTNELQTDDVPGLIAAQNDITAAAVWAVDATSQQTQGTFGQAIGDPVADTTTIYQAVATDAAGDNVAIDVIAVKAETALIVADTNELQTDDIPGTIAALNDIAAADIWAVDATSQQTQGTFGQAIGDPVADTTTIYQAVATDAAGDNVSIDVIAVKADTAAVLVDTADMQPKIGTPAVDVSADIAAVKVDTAAVLVDTGTAGVVLTSAERDSIAAALLDLAAGVESGKTVRQTFRIIAAAVAGKLSGAATTTFTIRNMGDTQDTITATVDGSGNRDAVTYNP